MSGTDPVPVAIRCRGGHVLGMQIGPIAVVKHDRRTYVGPIFYAVCKCGESWTAPTLKHAIDMALIGLVPALDIADVPVPDPADEEDPARK